MAAFNPVMSMAPPPVPAESLAHRPTMRRKSSAQNLLSSFKTGPSSSGGLPSGSLSSATGMPYASLPTPTVGSMPKEWDIQSLHSDSVATSAGASTATNGSGGQGASVEILRELVRKRIITLTYLRNVHEGRSHWFHTIMITRGELDRVFPNSAMKSRTYRFAMLGMGLASQFEMKDPHDLFKGWSNVLSEYDQSKEDGDKPKKSRLFRTRPQRRQAGATDYVLSSYQDPSDYMTMPHVPFQLDYHQTLLSLLDVLSELYNKISKILGPSPFPSSGQQHMMGPLGLLSPHPGVSYLFTGADPAPPAHEEGSLWGIAHANASGPGTPGVVQMYGGALGSPPPSWNSDSCMPLTDTCQKIIATLLKELDDCARAGIKDELASLDPLLRHVAVPEDAREYEFDS